MSTDQANDYQKPKEFDKNRDQNLKTQTISKIVFFVVFSVFSSLLIKNLLFTQTPKKTEENPINPVDPPRPSEPTEEIDYEKEFDLIKELETSLSNSTQGF